MGKTRDCISDSLFHIDYWFVIKIIFGFLTAVKMMSARHGHRHRRERRMKLLYWFDQQTENVQNVRQDVNQHVRQFCPRSWITKTRQNACHESPEFNRFVICDVVSLKCTNQMWQNQPLRYWWLTRSNTRVMFDRGLFVHKPTSFVRGKGWGWGPCVEGGPGSGALGVRGPTPWWQQWHVPNSIRQLQLTLRGLKEGAYERRCITWSSHE